MCQRHNSCTAGAIHDGLPSIHGARCQFTLACEHIELALAPFRPSASVRGSPRGRMPTSFGKNRFNTPRSPECLGRQTPLSFSISCFHPLRSNILHSEFRTPNSEFALAPLRIPHSELASALLHCAICTVLRCKLCAI